MDGTPEPAAVILMGSGLILLGVAGRKGRVRQCSVAEISPGMNLCRVGQTSVCGGLQPANGGKRD